MTPSQAIERQRAMDLHAGNLQAIKTLRETPAFAGYFLRRLNEKRAAADKEYHETPASEPLRQKIIAYDEMLGLLASDERQSSASLTALGEAGAG